jgi:hypothetical protein
MDYLIAPTLFQKKICRLPGIGTLSIIQHPTMSDRVGEKLKAPEPFIYFAASRENEDNIFNEFTALSELMKNDIERNGRVVLPGIGEFVKNENGGVEFIASHINPLFMPEVKAKRVIRQKEEHTLLVGDKETTNTKMTGYYQEEVLTPQTQQSRWWVWAIILGLIALATIIIYVSQNGFNLLGNDIKF